MEFVIEGDPKLIQHLTYERDPRIIKTLKEQRLLENGRLACEVCGFDFQDTYGKRGYGYIEAHHDVPLHARGGASRTGFEDLTLLCANCHTMIHTGPHWITVAELRQRLREGGA
ncbi:HNH endonuclease [compost metagenome]